ncbi:hypothetical protein JG687_00009925 [Phytophthora cactorum]|uniref:Uncharacterized protein n=1 Tax=Phytophthora cactorum TaxID=29920 RepID=A0A329RQX1_9STRA|nr:hypothetical protein PC119_g17642 [Phytophthora cactorum]KAG6957528.1 hypothetical protein JG687_00009925 [Phytophthora cactorum]RAW26046.1 hypothetical protein PC110_g17546 [Phytophthora cactorum]
MVEWLKVPEDFNIIVGKITSDLANGFGGAQTKLSWCGKMAKDVYVSCITTFIDQGEQVPANYTVERDARSCQSRWTSLFKTYKTTKQRLDSQTGFGMNEDQTDDGKRMEDVMEEACPFFYVLDNLFGERQNIHPFSVHDSFSILSQQPTQSSGFPSSPLHFNLASTTIGPTATPTMCSTPSQSEEAAISE